MIEKNEDNNYSDEEIARRMNAGIRRALNTAPTPTKELIGKGKLETAKKKSRVIKAARSKPKSP
jgi:hypothetical protein